MALRALYSTPATADRSEALDAIGWQPDPIEVLYDDASDMLVLRSGTDHQVGVALDRGERDLLVARIAELDAG